MAVDNVARCMIAQAGAPDAAAVQAAVETYLSEHPVTGGATEEQVLQIEKNRQDILTKQDALTDEQLDAANSGITAAQVLRIVTLTDTYINRLIDSKLSSWEGSGGGSGVITYPYVQNIESETYGFTLNSSGYYESSNQGVNASYSICKVLFNCAADTTYTFSCINYAEANYDFGIFSEVDTMLASSYSADSTGVYKSFKGLSSADIQTVEYTIPAGSHFVCVKFVKDGSQDLNNDSLQFKVAAKNSSGGSSAVVITSQLQSNSGTGGNTATLTFTGSAESIYIQIEGNLSHYSTYVTSTDTADAYYKVVNDDGSTTVVYGYSADYFAGNTLKIIITGTDGSTVTSNTIDM